MRSYSVITDKCIKDMLCVRACLRQAIHPLKNEAGFTEARQLFINPRKCLGCGSCMSACKNGAIFAIEELPIELQRFAGMNAAHYQAWNGA